MTTKKPTRAQGPHIPPPYELADASAFQALQLGTAEPHQQQRALKWLIEQAAGLTGLGQGREQAKEFLKANPDVAAEIDAKLRSMSTTLEVPVAVAPETE